MAQAETQQSAKTSFSEADKIIKCVNALGNQLTLVHSIGAQRTKSQFDGLSADQFLKWLAEIDNIYLEVDRDENPTTWAASQPLRGSALEYYHHVAPSLGSWDHLKTLMHAHYHHLHDADMAKQLRTITQRQKETIPQYTDRLKLLAKQAYGTTVDEYSVKEIITKAFINGIIHRKLQERIASKRPKTLKEAYNIAMDKTKLMTELSLYTDHSKSETKPMDCSAVSDQKSELSEVKDLPTKNSSGAREPTGTASATSTVSGTASVTTPDVTTEPALRCPRQQIPTAAAASKALASPSKVPSTRSTSS